MLPNEILLHILFYVQKPKDLLAVVLVSYRFKQVADTLLYRDISLDLRGVAKHASDPWHDSRRLCRSLLRKLSGDISLANNVSMVSIRANSADSQHFAEYQQLTKLLPRLRSLAVKPPPITYVNLDRNILLSTLRLDFRIEYPGFLDMNPLDDTLRFLETLSYYIFLPSLRVLEVDGLYLNDRAQSCNLPIVRGRSSNITTLRLASCSGEGKSILNGITSCFEKLTSLTLDFWHGARPSFAVYGLSPADSAETAHVELATLNHKERLTELAIASSGTAYFRPKSPDFWSFISYLSLKSLAIPEKFLLAGGHILIRQSIPPNLEELQLEYSTDDEFPSFPGLSDAAQRFERLDVLADGTAIRTPNLKRVVWWHQYPPNSKSDIPHEVILRLKDLRDRWEEKGIEFGVFMSCDWHETPFATGTRVQEPRSFQQSSTVGQWLDLEFFW